VRAVRSAALALIDSSHKSLLTCIYNVYTLESVDVRYSLRGLLFEWDREKATTNLRKHGVSFEEACEVFLDPLLLLRDSGDAEGLAQVVIGETVNERLLFVVHIIKQDEAIRIVSARPVTSHERREYEE
jgi:uncharacterized DUF497 family protein